MGFMILSEAKMRAICFVGSSLLGLWVCSMAILSAYRGCWYDSGIRLPLMIILYLSLKRMVDFYNRKGWWT